MSVDVHELWGEKCRVFWLVLSDASWEKNPNAVLLKRAAKLVKKHNPGFVSVTGITMSGDNEFQLFVCMGDGS